MGDIRKTYVTDGKKDCFWLGNRRWTDDWGRPPLGVGFVYDTPLKNFPPF